MRLIINYLAENCIYLQQHLLQVESCKLQIASAACQMFIKPNIL